MITTIITLNLLNLGCKKNIRIVRPFPYFMYIPTYHNKKCGDLLTNYIGII